MNNNNLTTKVNRFMMFHTFYVDGSEIGVNGQRVPNGTNIVRQHWF